MPRDAGAAASIAGVIVHYGSWDPTKRSVSALRAHGPGIPLVVVDNGPDPAPPPGWPEEWGANVIRPGKNLGYGAACNLGARGADAPLLLLSNNDVEVGAETVEILRRRLESDPGLAAVGPRFLDGSERPTRSVRRAPTPWRLLCENLFLARLLAPLPFFQGHHTVFVDEARPREVETLLGALILIRRDAFESVGGFDEDYFFYAEETDLCARLVRSGWRLAYEPGARAVHHEGTASESVPRATLDLWLHRGLLRYSQRFHGAAGRRRAARALRAGARLRWLVSFLPGRAGSLGRRQRYAAILALYRAGLLEDQSAAATPAR